MKLDAKSILDPTAILFAICVIVAAALAGTNLLTKDQIALRSQEKAEESRRIVLPAAEEFEPQEDGAYYAGLAGARPWAMCSRPRPAATAARSR